MLSNPGYESGKTSWGTNFTNSLTVVSGTQALFGSASLKFEPQSSVFTEVYSPLLNVPRGIQGQQCNAIVNYKTNEYTNYFVAKVKDASGTELITDVLLPKIIMGVPTEGANSLTLAFECPVSQQIELEISQTISGGYITLDGMHLGSKTGGLGTAEDIIDALGYTPADEVDLNAVSATATVNTAAIASVSATTLKKASNLSDLADASTARTNLGLGTVAVENTVPVTKGGTGQTTYATGDLLVGSGTTLAKTPKGGNNQAFVTREDSVGWKEIDTSGGFNLAIDNPSFESSTTGYTTSGTVTLFRQDRQSDGVNYSPSDIKYLEIATNTDNGGACRTDTIPQNLENSSFELNFRYRTTSFAASSTMVVYQQNGTNVTSQTVSLDTNSVGLSQPFIDYKAYRGVTSGTLTTCWLKSSTSLNSLDVDIDNVYVGAQKSLVNGAIVGPTTPYVPTLVGFGTITDQGFSYARVGDSLYITGRFVAGTTTAVEARIPLPDNLVIASSVVSNRTRGQIYRSGFSDDYTVLINGGNSYVNIGITTAKLTPVNADTFAASGNVISFSAGPIPIQGQSGTGVSFDGRCPNDISCTNDFSAYVSFNDSVLTESLDFLGATCTGSTGVYACTFNTGVFTVTPSCQANVVSASDRFATVTSISSSAITVTVRDAAAALSDSDFMLSCSKQGADFVAKRTIQGYLTKTVSTAGNYIERLERLRVVGTTENTNCTASPCAILRQSGGASSVTRSGTGAYAINFPAGTFANTPSCTGGGSNGGNNTFITFLNSTATAININITTDAGTSIDSRFDIICVGPR